MEHEERHALNHILDSANIVPSIVSASDSREEWIDMEVDAIVEYIHGQARNELVAYLEISDFQGKDYLNPFRQDSRLYNFFAYAKKAILEETFSFPGYYKKAHPEDPISIQDLSREVYDRIGTKEQKLNLVSDLQQATDAYILLLNNGFNHHQALILLDTEPISRWLHIANRVIGTKPVAMNPIEHLMWTLMQPAIPTAERIVQNFHSQDSVMLIPIRRVMAADTENPTCNGLCGLEARILAQPPYMWFVSETARTQILSLERLLISPYSGDISY
jgi:hypothetical protein